MYALTIATIATLKLFAPLFAAVAAAAGLFGLSRIVGQRKYALALEHVGGPWMPLHACVTTTPLSVACVPGLDFQGYVNRLTTEDSSPRKPVKFDAISPNDSASMTLVTERIYLRDRDVIEC
jgi:hypothetical protein